ncbi:MAG: hypothetical protein JWP45_341 [Mucilaginibacter sp.]|nr:hypothetical protein [Mucilaginibacter sp.]
MGRCKSSRWGVNVETGFYTYGVMLYAKLEKQETRTSSLVS